MSEPRHAFKDRWGRRNYRFDGNDVLSVTTIGKNVYSYHLEQWKLKRISDITFGVATRALRDLHREWDPDEKGQRHDSPAVALVMKRFGLPSQAAELGIGVHEALESWMETGRVPDGISETEQARVERALEWIEKWNVKPIHAEPEVYSESGYAGSVDAIVEIGGEPTIIDWKTGGFYESAAMQLAAYQHADRLYPRTSADPCPVVHGGECECTWEPMPVIDRLAVVQITPDQAHHEWVTPVAAGLAWRAFEGAMAINRLKKEKALFVPARRAVQEEAA